MDDIRWGIIGPGAIAHNFATGLAEAEGARLTAVAGRDAARREAFAAAFDVPADGIFDSYDALLRADAAEAVYIAVPHPWHAELAVQALRAGKHVLVEKPAGLTAAEVTLVTEVAAETGRFFMEGYMYRCHPQIARLVEIITAGEIGEVRHIRSDFGFASTRDAASRLYDPALAGGAILDVGGYPVSFSNLVAGLALGTGAATEPETVTGTAIIGPTGVDETAHALLTYAGGLVAECGTSVQRGMDNRAIVTGTKGRIVVEQPWDAGRNAGPSDAALVVTPADGPERREEIRRPEMLFTFEAAVASKAIRDGAREAPAPAMSHRGSVAQARTLDRWRRAAGAWLDQERPEGNRSLGPVLPAGLPQIPTLAIAGVPAPLSSLVMGCDNQDTLSEGGLIWDAYWEAGGRSFDTAFVYGGGRHEEVLGAWLRNRGLAGEAQVIAKGAHSPYCTPRAIAAQLDMSLDRLGLDHVPLYIMHRDNPDVPVEEFVDALNALVDAGRIGAFGGSNWSVARLQAANTYAAKAGKAPFRVLNNNLSLAVMERPVWGGCVTAHAAETLAYLGESGMAHLSWSSQARGYFLDRSLRDRLPADIGPEACFGSAANAERRARAETLAAERGVSANTIALAWVLAQPFPSAALIGPRSVGELASSLPALAIDLSPEDCAWLDLRGTRA